MKQCQFHPKYIDSNIKLGINPVVCYMIVHIMMKTLDFLTFFFPISVL